jgi:type I pantothenate kinase
MPEAKPPVSVGELAALVSRRAVPGEVLVVGVTGSVAAGKTTLSAALKDHLERGHRVELVSTDGFLHSNATLAARGLVLRKGYPETYDIDRLVGALRQARLGPAHFPGYSHASYDVDPASARTIDRPDILLLEGLGMAAQPDTPSAAKALDVLVYIDAGERALENWFVRRFIGFWRAAETDPASFYAQFRTMSEPEVDAFARMVWSRINLPNLREHIVQGRPVADIVVRKAADHSLSLARAARRRRYA